MLIAFVLIIVVTGLAILSSIYSIFTPFFQSFGNILDYNVAYYGAISAVERGELVLKYRGPGFVSSGGRLDKQSFGKPSDTVLTGFAIKFDNKNGILWNINSRTTRIPNTGEGNVDKDLLGTGSADYNKLDYKGVETILLSIDNTDFDGSYNDNSNYRQEYGGTYISGQFRLPPKVFSSFGDKGLCDDESSGTPEICDPDGDRLYNDIIVDWSLKGYYLGNQFFIMPNESVLYGTTKTVQDGDTTIREAKINLGSNIIFGSSLNVFSESAPEPDSQNIIGNNIATMVNENFSDILSDPSYTGLQLKFALINLLNSSNGNIYPFLEYYFVFDQPVADKFYNIQGNGRKGNYDVKIIIKKPTFKETVAGSFTVVF